MAELQAQMQPPNRGCGAVATADDDGDYIRELGDQVAELTIKEAAELTAYIKSKRKGLVT